MQQLKEKVQHIIQKIRERCGVVFAKKQNRIWAAASVVCFLAVIAGLVWVISDAVKKEKAQGVYENLALEMQLAAENHGAQGKDTNENLPKDGSNSGKKETKKGEKVVPMDPYEKKVDFNMLQDSVESNIYAWIYIPGTMIDYPILQHPSDNTYYLEHNLNGSKGYPGCIYTENYNAKDFSDSNTVIYGHNMKNGTMFADVHKFENSEYVKEHPYVYIYMPGKMYVYQVYAAYEYGNEHLIANRELSNGREFVRYVGELQEAADHNGFSDSDVKVAPDDKIITLSTCISGQDDKRFLMQAVLCEQVENPQ